MKPIESILHQLEALRGEAVRLSTSEFPYEYGREAVEHIIGMCSRNLDYLSDLPNDADTDPAESRIIATAARYVADAVPCLGFILRSTNVRNAFEVHGPLLRLARRIIGNDGLKLILSSEWSASPVNLMSSQVLPADFVLIGQPATESSNPFIIPLAGHELGHSLWEIRRLEKEFKSLIETAVISAVTRHWDDYKAAFQPAWVPDKARELLALSDLELPLRWCSAQAEELFCDATGIAMFGESYLRAFAYQLATLQHTGRSAGYPPMLERVKTHIAVAAQAKISVPDHYLSWFVNETAKYPLSPQTSLHLKIADEARAEITGNFITKAVQIVQEAQLPSHDETEIKRSQREFQRFTPVEKARCLSDILNAAWRALETVPFFEEAKHEEAKFSHLSEIVLKSIEIHEIEHCLKLEGLL